MTKPGHPHRSGSIVSARTHPLGLAAPLPKEISEVHRGQPSRDYKSSSVSSHMAGGAIDEPRRATSRFTRGAKSKSIPGVTNRLQANRKRKP
jgi:hypothetical protein